MKPFTGFSTDRQKTVRVPEGFFEDLLSEISSMLEMKATLYLFFRLARSGTGGGGAPRMCSLSELEADLQLRRALSSVKGPRTPEEALREALELAVSRGTLLQVWVREEPTDIGEGATERWYLLNTRDNRAWVDSVGKGEVDVAGTPMADPGAVRPGEPPNRAAGDRRIRVIAERPNVYTLYEQNIGLLTPILAERLQDAEARYPLAWIEDAVKEAVTNNKRNWRYIERILERWAQEGKDSGKDREPAGRRLDTEKYTKGKYAFLFRPDRP